MDVLFAEQAYLHSPDSDVEADENDDGGNESESHPEDASSDPTIPPAFSIGKVYPSLDAVKQAAVAFASENNNNFTIGVRSRDTMRLILFCRNDRVNCPFHLRAGVFEGGAKIVAINPNHNCEGKPPPIRRPASSIKFMLAELPKILSVDRRTSTKEIQAVLRRRFETEVSLQQCQRVKAKMVIPDPNRPKRKYVRQKRVRTSGSSGAEEREAVDPGPMHYLFPL